MLGLTLASCENATKKAPKKLQGLIGSNKVETVDVQNPTVWSDIYCIAVGRVDDVSRESDFLHLEKEALVRNALYGHLAPRKYRDVELALVDEYLYGPSKISDSRELLSSLECDALLRAKITKFTNEFYVTYSVTKVGLSVDLVNAKKEVVWSVSKEARSDAGAIPLSPFGLASGLFFATRNKHDEIAFRMIDAVARQVLSDLPDRISKRKGFISSGKSKQDMKSREDTIKEVSAALEGGNFMHALSLSEKMIAVSTKDDELFFLAGKSALGLGRFDRSKELFQKAINLNSEEHDYHNGLGLIHLKIGQPSEARESFFKALKVRDRNAVSHLGIAESFELEERYDLSAEYYFLAGSAAITRGQYAIALRSLAALEKLPKGSEIAAGRIKSLRAILSYNR